MAHINILNFKCDATFIKSDVTKNYNRGILLVNFNVPETFWLGPDEAKVIANITKVKLPPGVPTPLVSAYIETVIVNKNCFRVKNSLLIHISSINQFKL